MMTGRGGGKTKNSKLKNDVTNDADHLTIGFLSSAGGSGLTRLQPTHVRLPSLQPKIKQDLTLRKTQKKTFSPNIPTSRKLKNEPSEFDEKGSVEKGKNSPREKRISKRVKKKERKDVIKSESVFSMGPAGKSLQRMENIETATSSGTNALGQIRKRINSSNISGHDTSDHTLRIPMEDLEVEDELGQLSAHKVEDLFCDSQLPPIQLPLNHSSQDKQVIRTKKEFPDEDSKMNVDEPVRTNAAGLFTTTDSNSNEDYLFLQLPDCLPFSMESTTPETDTATANLTETGTNILHNIPEGLIGKLCIHRSGKVRLVLGEVSLDVSMGTPCGFLQELVSIKPSSPDPKMTVIGQVSHRLVCTPDFEDILSFKH